MIDDLIDTVCFTILALFVVALLLALQRGRWIALALLALGQVAQGSFVRVARLAMRLWQWGIIAPQSIGQRAIIGASRVLYYNIAGLRIKSVVCGTLESSVKCFLLICIIYLFMLHNYPRITLVYVVFMSHYPLVVCFTAVQRSKLLLKQSHEYIACVARMSHYTKG